MSRDRLNQSIAGAIVTAARFVIAWLLLSMALPARAQQLAVRRYDVSDGLAYNTVTSIYQNKKGYIWFGTFEGLSRFDGYRFTNYDTSDGLGHIIVNHIVEDRQGRLWVTTNGGGVSRLIDDPQESVVSGQWSVAKDEEQRTTDDGPRTKDQGQNRNSSAFPWARRLTRTKSTGCYSTRTAICGV